MSLRQLKTIEGGPGFNYAELDRETEVAAREAAAEIKALMRRTAEDVIRIGQRLLRSEGQARARRVSPVDRFRVRDG